VHQLRRFKLEQVSRLRQIPDAIRLDLFYVFYVFFVWVVVLVLVWVEVLV
jgi:hypothetical protein